MERLATLCWLVLAAVHVAPAAVLFRPELAAAMYGASEQGVTQLLIVHRGALFLGVAAVTLLAAFDPDARRAASLVAAISMIGFLAVYLAMGAPAALRTVALVDAAALLPLAVVGWRAWAR
jgi:fructose-specific phosphotransferase system IIC component